MSQQPSPVPEHQLNVQPGASIGSTNPLLITPISGGISVPLEREGSLSNVLLENGGLKSFLQTPADGLRFGRAASAADGFSSIFSRTEPLDLFNRGPLSVQQVGGGDAGAAAAPAFDVEDTSVSSAHTDAVQISNTGGDVPTDVRSALLERIEALERMAANVKRDLQEYIRLADQTLTSRCVFFCRALYFLAISRYCLLRCARHRTVNLGAPYVQCC
jgi:hypothetical protein